MKVLVSDIKNNCVYDNYISDTTFEYNNCGFVIGTHENPNLRKVKMVFESKEEMKKVIEGLQVLIDVVQED